MISESGTPLPLIRKLTAKYPGVWEELDYLYSNVWLRDPDYTPLCGLPIGAAFTLLVERYGIRIGSALRAAKQARSAPTGSHSGQTGIKKRAHTRRGHWHHYWVGAKNKPSERRLILKWTHPVLVGGSSGADAVTIHPVK